jgi:hypothetical protein
MKAIWAYMMRNEVGSWGRGAVISFSIFWCCMGWLASQEGFSIMKKIVKKMVKKFATKLKSKSKKFTIFYFFKIWHCVTSCQKSLDKELTWMSIEAILDFWSGDYELFQGCSNAIWAMVDWFWSMPNDIESILSRRMTNKNEWSKFFAHVNVI